MNWWEWVFSGIGVLALTLLIGWLRGRSPSSGHNATITEGGAGASGSPVASGSGIVQTVEATHHHYYGEQAEPPVPVPKSERPKPNLKISGGKTISIHEGLDGAFYRSEQGQGEGESVVVNITNDAQSGATNVGANVRATLLYGDAGQELLRVTGAWLSIGADMCRFRVDDSQSVILGVIFSGEFSVPSKRRVHYGLGHVAFPTDRNPLNFQRAAVTVRLTDADQGDFYCEERFEIAIGPLRISRP